MRSAHSLVALTLLLLAAAAPATVAGKNKKEKRNKDPDVVTVQHVLISFDGKVAHKSVERSKKEALDLAWEIFDRAEAGADFDALVKEYTDDSYPGVFKIANRGVARLQGHAARDGLAISFGDVSFRLAVGEIGMARFHAELSPYGYHVIKRLE